MALPSSGSISLNQVNVELKKTATAAISMNDSAVRALAKKTSGAISMSDLRGKSSEVRFVNSTNRTQANIHTLMGKPTAAGTYVFENTAQIAASSRGGWALQTGTFPAGSTLKIINRGHIRGGGGNGGGTSGGTGGTALVLNFPTTIENTSGTIWGGGGGGGSGFNNGTYQVHGGSGGAGIPAGLGASGSGTVSGRNGTATAGGAGVGGGGIHGFGHCVFSPFRVCIVVGCPGIISRTSDERYLHVQSPLQVLGLPLNTGHFSSV